MNVYSAKIEKQNKKKSRNDEYENPFNNFIVPVFIKLKVSGKVQSKTNVSMLFCFHFITGQIIL